MLKSGRVSLKPRKQCIGRRGLWVYTHLAISWHCDVSMQAQLVRACTHSLLCVSREPARNFPWRARFRTAFLPISMLHHCQEMARWSIIDIKASQLSCFVFYTVLQPITIYYQFKSTNHNYSIYYLWMNQRMGWYQPVSLMCQNLISSPHHCMYSPAHCLPWCLCGQSFDHAAIETKETFYSNSKVKLWLK